MATFEIDLVINRPVEEVFAFISRNTKKSILLFLVTSLILSGCGAGQIVTPTSTALPSTTPSLTPTPVPTQTSTPFPASSAYNPVPRWMILGQPGYGVEIFGEMWNYTNDRWGETYACIDYTREKEPYLFFEQCFAMTQPDLTFESQRDAFLNEAYEVLAPGNTFNDVGQISLMAKRLDDNSTKFVKFFEIIGVENYILLVEMNFVTDDQASLQTIYENQAAGIIDFALQNMLEKSRLVSRSTATPLSPTQESFYAPLAANLITEAEASVLYGSTWEALRDFVSSKRTQVCRDFEDRTNADVYWVRFSNCVYSFKVSTFEEIVDSYKRPGDIQPESIHPYTDKFALYGFQDGHTYFYAWMSHGEYIYFVELESRTLAGQKVEDLFTKDVDDFIYGVLMINAQR
jgi:hypothetical protein